MLDCWNIIWSGDPNLTPGTLQIHWSIHANNKYLFIDALVTRVDYFSEIALTKILSLRFHTEQLVEMLFKSDPSLPPPLRTHHNIFFFWEWRDGFCVCQQQVSLSIEITIRNYNNNNECVYKMFQWEIMECCKSPLSLPLLLLFEEMMLEDASTQ